MPPVNRKRQKVFTRLGFVLSNFWTTMYYTRTKLGKINPKTFCGTQSKNFHAKVWKVSLKNTTTWKIKSSTSTLNLCAPNKLAQIKALGSRNPAWSRNPGWPMEYTRMVQLSRIWKDVCAVKNMKRCDVNISRIWKDVCACAVTKFKQLRRFI